jgi:hypothetical protein
MRTAYVVIETVEAGNQPHFVGVFDSAELADEACTAPNHMMAKVDINRIEVETDWKYGYTFPRFDEQNQDNKE